MVNIKVFLVLILLVSLSSIILMSCDDAYVASSNLSQAADNFQIERRIVFYNGITGEYILVIQGRCSIYDDGDQLEVTVKTGPNSYKKHFLGLSDNVTYFAEQIESSEVDVYHYNVVFKPSVIIPTIQLK
jgi:hypothetical protein